MLSLEQKYAKLLAIAKKLQKDLNDLAANMGDDDVVLDQASTLCDLGTDLNDVLREVQA